ncbi:arsenite methyltransferase [soil metagenome]
MKTQTETLPESSNETNEELKQLVKEKYGAIADQSKTQNASSCCGATGCCDTVDYEIFAESYSKLEGYNPDADLGLGCGLPTEFAKIKEGDTVLDLGSGAGNDVFIARALTGEKGKVIGLDFTESMIEKAIKNNEKLGFKNVEFILGEIENMPIPNNTADVVVSNCVLNLVPDKEKAFKDIYRVIKNGGHFSVSDIVITGELPNGIQKAAEMYAGCVSGAIQKEDYLDIIRRTGFKNIEVQKEKVISVPDEILLKYISNEELNTYKESGSHIISVNVYAEKPCCEPGSGCC